MLTKFRQRLFPVTLGVIVAGGYDDLNNGRYLELIFKIALGLFLIEGWARIFKSKHD